MSKRLTKVGVIAEDYSDVDSVTILIHRLANNDRIPVRGLVGQGCGRVRRKCRAWAELLKERGCSSLIVLHDLDDRNPKKLKQEIEAAIDPCPIKRHLICIPVRELEAWLLSDPHAIESAMHLGKPPNVKASPETVNSPKEYLGELILRVSNGERIYINTKHNAKIAAEVSIDKVRNVCPSFIPFCDFVKTNL